MIDKRKKTTKKEREKLEKKNRKLADEILFKQGYLTKTYMFMHKVFAEMKVMAIPFNYAYTDKETKEVYFSVDSQDLVSFLTFMNEAVSHYSDLWKGIDK